MSNYSSSEPTDFETNSDSDWLPSESDLAGSDDDTHFDDSDHAISDTNQSQWLSIQPVSKKRSKSGLWQSFGRLMRNGRVIKKCAGRFYCKSCLEDNSLKR